MYFAAIDIGSPAKGNLGWWVLGPDIDQGGTDPGAMFDCLSMALANGPLALGFEAPMYVPAKREAQNLLRSRPGEGSRAWSVAAGATTTAVALAVVPWVLDELSRRSSGVSAWQEWTRRPKQPGELLVFEAFVSGGPSDGHAADARAAALAAHMVFKAADQPSHLEAEHCFSMLGAALLHAGMSEDLSELQRQCMVIRADKVLTQPVVK